MPTFTIVTTFGEDIVDAEDETIAKLISKDHFPGSRVLSVKENKKSPDWKEAPNEPKKADKAKE